MAEARRDQAVDPAPDRAADALRCVAHAAASLVANGWDDDPAWQDDFRVLREALPLCRTIGTGRWLVEAAKTLVAARGGAAEDWRAARDGLRWAVHRYHRAAAAHFHARAVGDAD